MIDVSLKREDEALFGNKEKSRSHGDTSKQPGKGDSWKKPRRSQYTNKTQQDGDQGDRQMKRQDST